MYQKIVINVRYARCGRKMGRTDTEKEIKG